jgi:hypothetical protein
MMENWDKKVKEAERISTDFIRQDPLSQRVVNRASVKETPGLFYSPSCGPTEAVFEQYCMAFNAVCSANTLIRVTEDWWWQHQSSMMRYNFWKVMWNAELYLWDTEIFLAATKLKIPAHKIQREQFPLRNCYWSFQNTINITVDRKEQGLAGILWWVTESGATAMLLPVLGSAQETRQPQVLEAISYDFGSSFVPVSDSCSLSYFSGQLLATLSFLKSRVLEIIPTKVPREIRKQTKREKKKQPPLVKVVALRRNAKSDKLAKEEGDTRSFTHRWLVSGHIRNQWYAKEGVHKLIYINPFIKGPEGADLLPARRTVNKVVR